MRYKLTSLRFVCLLLLCLTAIPTYSITRRYKLHKTGIKEDHTSNDPPFPRTIEAEFDNNIIVWENLPFEYEQTIYGNGVSAKLYNPILETTITGYGMPGMTPNRLVWVQSNNWIEIDIPMNYGNGLPYSTYIRPATHYEIWIPIE